MANFAQIDKNSVVINIKRVEDVVILDSEQNEVESKGVEILKNIYGQDTNWVQTSYSNSFRKRFAAKGMTYNEEDDCFAGPKPFESWSWDSSLKDWLPPVAEPDDGNDYSWIEETLSWGLDMDYTDD